MLTREKIVHCLKLLGEELKKEGMSGEILLTGGAAMCLVHSARDMTKDVDALYEPKAEINLLVKKIAEQEGLPEDWLNDGVKGFVIANAPTEGFMVLDGLKITVVTPEYLLAMKLMSARYGETDARDIRFLMNKFQIRTADEAFDILTRFYPPDRILPKTMYMVQECVDELQSQSHIQEPRM